MPEESIWYGTASDSCTGLRGKRRGANTTPTVYKIRTAATIKGNASGPPYTVKLLSKAAFRIQMKCQILTRAPIGVTNEEMPRHLRFSSSIEPAWLALRLAINYPEVPHPVIVGVPRLQKSSVSAH